MPTYQYTCTECTHAFEQVQSFSDDALTECPECQGRLRKLFNAVGVVFKGSGFYRNDSRKPAAAESGSSSSGDSSSGSSGESSSDSSASGDSSTTPSTKPSGDSSGSSSSAGSGSSGTSSTSSKSPQPAAS